MHSFACNINRRTGKIYIIYFYTENMVVDIKMERRNYEEWGDGGLLMITK